MMHGSVALPVCPFVGLRAFEYADREFFFGRKEQIDALEPLILMSRFVAVVGSSGSGKSSLIRAGILPRLDERSWGWVEMRPGNAPIRALAECLGGPLRDRFGREDYLAQARIDRIEMLLHRSSFGLSEAIALLPHLRQKPLLILVDQFEELFRFADLDAELNREPKTAAARRDEATSFVRLLLAGARTSMPVHVVITMRSDFIGDCSKYHGLPEAVTANQFLVPGLTRDQRANVICLPVRHAGGSIDVDLVQRALNDTIEDADQLPILQHVMMRCWQRAYPQIDEAEQGPPALVSQHYIMVGGAAHALSVHANEVLADLRKASGAQTTSIPLDLVAKRVFQALTDVDKSGRVTRRPQKFGDLLHCGVGESASDEDLKHPAVREAVSSVIYRFADQSCSFLRAPKPEELDDNSIIDIGHEALIRRWDVLKGSSDADWIREEQEDGEQYRGLVRMARAGAVIPAEELAAIEGWWRRAEPNRYWAARYGSALIGERFTDQFDQVIELLERSRLNAMQLEEQRLRDAKAKSRREKYHMAIAAGILIIASLGAVLWSEVQKHRAEVNQLKAEEEARAAQVNANFASAAAKLNIVKVLAFAADRVSRPAGANGPADAAALLLSKPSGLPNAFEYHKALFQVLGDLRETRRIIGISTPLSGLAFSSKNKLIVGAGPSQGKVLVQFWAADTGHFIDSLELPSAGFANVRWNPAGERILVGSSPTAFIVTPCSRPKLREFFSICGNRQTDIVQPVGSPENPAGQAAWSTDGQRILTGGFQREAKLWNASDGSFAGVWSATLRRFTDDRSTSPQPAAGIAFSPRGDRIAIGSPAGEIFIVDAKSLILEKTLSPRVAHGAALIFAIAFNPIDPNMLISTSQNMVQLWDVTSGSDRQLPHGGAAAFQAVFDPSGRFLATSSDDGTIRVFPLNNGESRNPILLRGHRGPAFSLDVSSEGVIVSGSNDRTIRFWDRYAPLSPRAIEGGVVASNGAKIETSDRIVTITRQHSSVSVLLPPNAGEVQSGDLSPDGKYVLIALKEKRPLVYLRDQRENALGELRGPSADWKGVAVSASGTSIVATTAAGISYEWPFFGSIDQLKTVAERKLPFLLRDGGRVDNNEHISPPPEVLCVLGGEESCRTATNND